MIDATLKLIKEKIFEEPEVEIVISYQNHNQQTIRQLLHYYHVTEDDPKKENLRNIQMTEVERERVVEGSQLQLE
jgi:hypothetical protein